jgi:hypothetical protein
VLKIPIAMLPFDGARHAVAWDIRPAPGRCRLWIDNVLIGEEATTSGGALWLEQWAGEGGGGYLRVNGAGTSHAGVASGAVWWSDAVGASALRIWSGHLHDASAQSFRVLAPSRNPAPWLLETMTGRYNADPIPADTVDMTGIIDWRRACYAAGHACDMVAEGESLSDLLRIIASCGYARPYQSETWGVIRDRDRSADAPVQIFSPRNTRGFSWTKAFARTPAGFRVTYRDASTGYGERQVTVYRAGAMGTDIRLEEVTYEGLVDEGKVIERAHFDLAQAEHRSTFYDLSAPVEALRCRRGSLVGVAHDILTRHVGYGRVVEVISSAGQVMAIKMDAECDILATPDLLDTPDMLAVPDMLDLGARTGIAIRRTDGAVSVHALADPVGPADTLTLSPPVPVEIIAGQAAIDIGCLVVTGTIGREYRRLIVSEIRNAPRLTAQLTLVDEAPQIWS